jgi:hypothetical protein
MAFGGGAHLLQLLDQPWLGMVYPDDHAYVAHDSAQLSGQWQHFQAGIIAPA